jgi:hypothetical protein
LPVEMCKWVRAVGQPQGTGGAGVRARSSARTLRTIRRFLSLEHSVAKHADCRHDGVSAARTGIPQL